AADGWDVVAPTFRVDLLREVDLIEEVGRHYGFDKLPDTFPPMRAAAPPPDPRIARDQTVRRVLTAIGLSEAVTFGFIEARAADGAGGGGTPIGIAGQLAARIADARGLPRQDQVFVVELDLDAMWRAAAVRHETVRSLPRHPLVVRDLSILVANTLPAEIIRG